MKQAGCLIKLKTHCCQFNGRKLLCMCRHQIVRCDKKLSFNQMYSPRTGQPCLYPNDPDFQRTGKKPITRLKYTPRFDLQIPISDVRK